MFRTCNMFALHNFLKTNYFLSSNWSSSMLATSSIRFLSFQEFSRSLHHQDTFRVLLRWYILGVAAWVRHLVGKCRPGISSNILQVGLVPSLDSKIKNYSDSVKIKIYLISIGHTRLFISTTCSFTIHSGKIVWNSTGSKPAVIIYDSFKYVSSFPHFSLQ